MLYVDCGGCHLVLGGEGGVEAMLVFIVLIFIVILNQTFVAMMISHKFVKYVLWTICLNRLHSNNDFPRKSYYPILSDCPLLIFLIYSLVGPSHMKSDGPRIVQSVALTPSFVQVPSWRASSHGCLPSPILSDSSRSASVGQQWRQNSLSMLKRLNSSRSSCVL